MTDADTPDVLVDIEALDLTYPVMPGWLRPFLRTSSPEPVTALTDVSLRLRRADLVGIIGPNGAGKTSLFRVLLGLVRPTSGRAHVLGTDVTVDSLANRRRIGYLPADDRSLFLRFTCHENLAFHGRLHGFRGTALQDRIAEVLALVGLDHATDRVGIALSSGMRYRLMLARALMHDPMLLVLDEPTGPLDPVAAHEFIGLLRDIVARRRIGALVSSHRLDDIEAMPDRVVLMDGGRILHDGGVAELRARVPGRLVVVTFRDAHAARASASAMAALVGADQVEVDGSKVLVASDEPVGALLEPVEALEQVLDVRVREPALREVMARILATDGAA